MLHCELVEAEPEEALPALALGDLDVVLGDEWSHAPVGAVGRMVTRAAAPRPGAAGRRVELEELADAVWVSGTPA